MSFTAAFLPEFDQEMTTTRSLLERVPMEKADFKPHPRSTALGTLAAHIAGLAGFANAIASKTEINMAPADGQTSPRPPASYATTDALLTAFDANVASARQAVAGVADADAATPWSLKNGATTVFTMPRSAALRTMMLNHIIHHRGQLSVYLRLNDVPLPSIYGPTADT